MKFQQSASAPAGAFAATVSIAGIGLVLAQDVFPAWTGFHAWPYAASLTLVAAVVLGAFRGADAAATAALLGTLVIVCAGIGSGLLGPDTEVVARAPGTVAPIPGAAAAAFFPDAGAADIARGDARVLIRRTDGGSFDLGAGDRKYAGATEISLQPHLAAYVEARDAVGRHLTITQPTNPAFLSPVLLFTQNVTVAGKLLPADSFAAPALHREIKVFYFSKSDSQLGRSHGVAGIPSLLFAVDDSDSGKTVPGGIAFVRSGGSANLGGIRLHGTIGSYPAVVISAVPYGPALALGALLVFGGLGVGLWESELRHIVRRA
jgi:hypothetical protein